MKYLCIMKLMNQLNINRIKIINKMGNLTDQSYFSHKDYSKLHTKSGIAYFVHKSTKKQFITLHSHFLYQPNSFEERKIYCLLQKRKKLSSSILPFLQHYEAKESQFCGTQNQMMMAFAHPSKSLKEEKQNRKNDGFFSEGQIWMIAYRCLQSLALYSRIGINVQCKQQNVYISTSGQIILSDAHFWVNYNSENNEDQERVEEVGMMINDLMEYGGRILYSQEIKDLGKALLCENLVNSRQGLTKLIELRKKMELKYSQNEKKWLFNTQSLTDRNTQNTRSYKQKFPLNSSFQQISLENIVPEQLSQILPKFTNTCSFHQLQSFLSNGTIYQEKGKIVQESKKKHIRTLSQKNRECLQNLINNQRNIIFQVTESEIEKSSLSHLSHFRTLSKQTQS